MFVIIGFKFFDLEFLGFFPRVINYSFRLLLVSFSILFIYLEDFLPLILIFITFSGDWYLFIHCF